MKHIYLLWGDIKPTFVQFKTDADFNNFIKEHFNNTDRLLYRKLNILQTIIFKIQFGISVLIDMLLNCIRSDGI